MAILYHDGILITGNKMFNDFRNWVTSGAFQSFISRNVSHQWCRVEWGITPRWGKKPTRVFQVVCWKLPVTMAWSMPSAFLTVLLNTKRERSNRSGHKVKRLYIYNSSHVFSYNIRHRNFVAISKLVQCMAGVLFPTFRMTYVIATKPYP